MNPNMLRFFTSLTFLYALTIIVLLLYGFFYYRSFARSGYRRRWFPYIFLIISTACFGFLWFNIHAPLNLKTFSNLDHYSIRHDGFQVDSKIELGRSDTVNYPGNSYNSFLLEKKNDQVTVSSSYAEDPFYISEAGVTKLLSRSYPSSEWLRFRTDTINTGIRLHADSSFELSINGTIVSGRG